MTTPVTPRVGPDPKSYFDPLVFQREQREVFQRAWCFVAFSWELAKPNDFVTRTLGGVSVVVQNFGGELKALHNVCAHRCSLIRTAPCGNGPLTCGFHGWTYDGRGVPVGIPGNAEFFGFTDEQKQARALRSFALETCGAFVFVRIAAEGPGLRAFLGPQWAVLQTLSKHFGAQPPLDDHRMPWATNWKVGVESVLEVYRGNLATKYREYHRTGRRKEIEPCGERLHRGGAHALPGEGVEQRAGDVGLAGARIGARDEAIQGTSAG